MTIREDMPTLVLRVALERDRIAFAQLFDHFAPRIDGYLQRLGTDPATAEEIVQDVMTTLWQKADLFDPVKSSLATWLYRIARNRRIDGLRRDRSAQLDRHEPALQPTAAALPDAVIDGQVREGLVRQVLEALPNDQQGLIRFAFFEGLSHSQIAERTSLPLGTVKSRIRLAFARLRQALEAEGITDAG